MNRSFITYFSILTLVVGITAAHSAEPTPKSYYLIGNSLTWDTLPGQLDGDVQWHVDCGRSLPSIQAAPDEPCVKTSTLWPTALKEKQYDVISIQPHYGSTLEQDIETISAFIKLQPKAIVVIHSGWAFHSKCVDEFATFDPYGMMQHSPAYLTELLSRLRQLHPERTFRQTRATHLLQKVADDIAAKQAPFANVNELYRDDIHMKPESGKYLMHNAMRHALGQPLSSKGFESVDPKVKAYLDNVLHTLSVADADQQLLADILSPSVNVDRSALVMKVTNAELKKHLNDALPAIDAAVKSRAASEPLETEITSMGGKLYFERKGPEWLYLATDSPATEVFKSLVGIDLYNGNNPLKGKGGKNEQVTNAWLAKLSGLTSLKKLGLSNCQIDDEGLHHLKQLVALRDLDLTLTPVTDKGLAQLSTLVELRNLGLASTQCTGSGFTHLQALDKLENVNFHFTPLNDAGLAAISEVGISGRLWFAHTHFSDAGSKSLAKLKQLRRCGMGSNDQVSSGEAVAALIDLPLEDLSLLDRQASPIGVAHATKIATLRRLDVSYGPEVNDASLKLVAGMPKLEEFKLGSSLITDEGLKALAESKSLKKVTLEGAKKITEAAAAEFRKAKPDLVLELR